MISEGDCRAMAPAAYGTAREAETLLPAPAFRPVTGNAMSSDTETHRELIAGLKAAMADGMAKRDGSFEQAVTRAFEHVFDHLERLNSHVSLGGPGGEDRALKAGESSTLR